MPDKLIGILGGVGPWATVDMFKKFLEAVSAERDQDYPRLLIYCNSKIPDRNKAIMDGGVDPTPALQETARALERAGADFIVIGSNGTHYYHDAIQRATTVPVLNMVEETANFIKTERPDVNSIGLVAATCTVSIGLYEKYFQDSSQKLLVPPEDLQEQVMEAIYEVKTGLISKPKETMKAVAQDLVRNGAGAIVCGCTEVSVGLEQQDLTVPIIDPIEVVARVAVKLASEDEPVQRVS